MTTTIKETTTHWVICVDNKELCKVAKATNTLEAVKKAFGVK